MNLKSIKNLQSKVQILRKNILNMIYYAGSGHPGGSLSCIDILTCLYFFEMRVRPKQPDWKNRDRFILSKGHACPALYAVLGEKGFFSKANFKKLRHINAMLQGHPDRLKTPGVDFNSGSLGQGFSFGIGVALGAKITKRKFRVYVVTGCGELDEGQLWEGALFASHNNLDNLMVFIDYNKLQSDDYNKNILNLEPLKDKWIAFGWNVLEINGHNIKEILTVLDRAKSIKDKPTICIAHTIKGKGISFMENKPKWHGSLAPTKTELKIALRDLNEKQ